MLASTLCGAQEASKQLRLLKGELEAYLDEGEAQKTKRKEAEER